MKLTSLVTFNLIKTVTVIALLMQSPPVFSQSEFLNVKNNWASARVRFDQNFLNTRATISDSIIYYTPMHSSKGKRVIYSHNLENQKVDSIFIKDNKKFKNFMKERILSFSIIDNRIVFICSDHIFFFDITGGRAKYISQIENKYYFDKSFVLGKNILLSICYNFHPEDSPNKHVWGILNPKIFQITQVTFQPEKDAMFGSFVNSWIDVKNDQIMYARSSEYKITFHDHQFRVTDSIYSDELISNNEYIKDISAGNLYSKDAIIKLKSTDDSLLTRIRKVFYLNDNNVLVILKLPGKDSIRSDYWRKTENGWVKTASESIPIWYQEGVSYSGEKITYTDFYQNVFGFRLNGTNKFYLAYFPYMPIVVTNNFDSEKDYYKLQNDAIQRNELFFGIKEISVDTPND